MTVVGRWPNSGGLTVQVEGAKKKSQQQLIRLKGVSFMLHSCLLVRCHLCPVKNRLVKFLIDWTFCQVI